MDYVDCCSTVYPQHSSNAQAASTDHLRPRVMDGVDSNTARCINRYAIAYPTSIHSVQTQWMCVKWKCSTCLRVRESKVLTLVRAIADQSVSFIRLLFDIHSLLLHYSILPQLCKANMCLPCRNTPHPRPLTNYHCILRHLLCKNMIVL